MKTTFSLLLLTFITLTGYCADNLIHFSAALDGNHALPPNDSPFQATAKLSFGNRLIGGGPSPAWNLQGGVWMSNTLLVQVWFTPSNVVNDLGIELATATIQTADGDIVTELPRVTNNPCTLFPGGPSVPEVRYAGFFVLLPEQVADLFAGRWYIHITAVTSSGEDYPAGAIRGQILPVDSDRDGVPDYKDRCPNTPVGAAVNNHGCSIKQLVPCNGPWKNHGEYVSRMEKVTAEFVRRGCITPAKRIMILRESAKSDCGKKPVHRQ